MLVFLVACRYRRGGRLVTEPESSTKFASLSVIEQESEPVSRELAVRCRLGHGSCTS